MSNSPRPPRLAILGLLILTVSCVESVAPRRFAGETELWQRMLATEDGRAPDSATVATLADGLRSTNPALWQWAIRGLGRLEREDALPTILLGLTAPSPAVRREAVNAAAQAMVHGDPAPVRTALLAQLSEESDPLVRGVIAATLGRLRHNGPGEVRTTVAQLTDIAGISRDRALPGNFRVDSDTWLGVARGFFHLFRQPAAAGPAAEDAVAVLRVLMTHRAPPELIDAGLLTAEARRLAAAALAASGRITQADIEVLLADDFPMVRREGAAAIAVAVDRSTTSGLAERAASDENANVRFEGIRAILRVVEPARACTLLLQAIHDASPHISLLAIDGTAEVCGRQSPALAILDSLVRSLPAVPDPAWHQAAHALVAMTRLSPARAARALPPFAEHGNDFVRTWAARAALLVKDEAMLLRLAGDASPNVRTAAIQGLQQVLGHQADSVYSDQLVDDDSQLLQAAAAALEGGDPAALPRLLDTFDRVSAARRETWRDSRRALLRRIREFGSTADADRIRPYLADYDTAIARLAADVLEDWTGDRQEPRPVPLPRLPLPTLADLEALDTAEATIEMGDGGIITLRFHAFLAPTNAWRFARLAREGYYDGLTFHRVAPNFVIQGGSPGANEYAGDGPYTRDEVGLMSNARGTIGLSTRGRDTGDAQFYINLIDNTRLDHDYTVFAQVVSGMDVVDGILEGAVIRRISVAGS